MTDGEFPAIIVDNGSCNCKVGFAGDDVPQLIFPSITGRPKQGMADYTHVKSKDVYVGHDAMDRQSVMDFRYPIEEGIITNWDDMERVRSRSSNKIYLLSSCKRGILFYIADLA